jgi:hypothetical protein
LYDNNSNTTSEIVRNSAKRPDWRGITQFLACKIRVDTVMYDNIMLAH